MKTTKRNYIPFLLVLLLFSCNTKNKVVEMQEVAVFVNYSVKLPLKAVSVRNNRWKIESSSQSFLTTIILKESSQIKSITSDMNSSLMSNNTSKSKVYYDSKQEISKSGFIIYINN